MLDKITLTAEFEARPDDVFMALTDSGLISKWSGQKAGLERKVGGQFEMFDGWVKGRVLEFKPSRLLSYSWRPEEWAEEVGESIVRFSIARTGKETTVKVEHWGFPNEEEMKSHEEGWKQHFFEPLKAYFEKRNAEKKRKTSPVKKAKPVKKNLKKKSPVKKGTRKK